LEELVFKSFYILCPIQCGTKNKEKERKNSNFPTQIPTEKKTFSVSKGKKKEIDVFYVTLGFNNADFSPHVYLAVYTTQHTNTFFGIPSYGTF